MGLFNKRVGEMWQDNGANHQAVAIDPFNITNVFVNYQLRGLSQFQNTRIRFAVNNLTDSHAITGVTPASVNSNTPAAGDILTLMSGRSVSVSLTLGFSPR
jgi:iron complex outermembrane receptor protein